MLQQDPEIITGGPVIWWINISSFSRLPKICFFPCIKKWADQPIRNVPFPAKNQRSFRDQPSVQHPPTASRALTPWSMGTTSFNLQSPCPKPWATALRRSWDLPSKTFRCSELLPCRSGMGSLMERGSRELPCNLSIPLPSPIRSVLFVFKLSLCVCWAASGWLCSQLHPLMSVGLRWWNQEENLAPRLFIPPLFFFFFALLSLSPARCLACPGLLLPLGWELLLCSSCCLARLRCFGSNLGSKHICSAFCFLPPSLLAVKHFIIQTLWKALYKMKLWGYLFWCSQSNSVSYFPPLIFSSLDNT